MRRLLCVPFPYSRLGSGSHGESVPSVAVKPSNGETGHVWREFLQAQLFTSGGVDCGERGKPSALSERADTSAYSPGISWRKPWAADRTGLVLQGISSNDAVGFCRYVPVDINTVEVPLLDPEGSGNGGYLKPSGKANSTGEVWKGQLGAPGASRLFERGTSPPSGVEKWTLLLGGPSNRLLATTMYIL